MSTANKLTYLNGTKQAIKNAINEDFEVVYDKGKNLLDMSTLVDGFVSSNGTFDTSHTKEEMRSNYIAVKPNTTYTFKIFESSWSGFNTQNWFGVGKYDSNKTFISRDTMTTGTQAYITFTTSATTEYIVVSARGLASATKVQLEENSTPTDYEPYVEETTFREYANKISSNNAKYKDLIPKETTNATNTLDISNSSGLDKALVTQYGNTYQANAILPSGYTQVDYIESTSYTHNSNYIDLNFKPNNNTAIEVKMEYTTSNAQYGRIFGSSNLFRTETAASNDTRTTFYWNNGSIITEYAGANVIKIYKLDKNKVYIDGTLTHTFTTTTFQDTYNLRLFSASTGNRDSLIRIYYAKLWDNGTLIRDMIPCIQTSSNKVGMYDLANNVFYENGGNVAFVYGSTVNIPNPDYPQTITNVTGTNTIKINGKNLFDVTTIRNAINGSISNNTIISNTISTSYGGVSANITGTTLSPGTYYLSLKAKIDSGSASALNKITLVGINNDEVTEIEKPTISSSYQIYVIQITINETKTITNIGVQLGYTNTNAVISYKDIMISKYSDTTYEPYQEQSYTINLGDIELCKIGDYKDRIYYSSGKWYLEKNIGKVVLNGSESWSLFAHSDSTDISQLYTNVTNAYTPTENEEVCIASHFKKGKWNSYWTRGNEVFLGTSGRTGQLWLTPYGYTTASDFKTWLSTHNTTVYYVLATPTTTEITESNYPTLYNQLNNIKLFEGVNHIAMTNESGLDVEFDIEYYKDWKLD